MYLHWTYTGTDLPAEIEKWKIIDTFTGPNAWTDFDQALANPAGRNRWWQAVANTEALRTIRENKGKLQEKVDIKQHHPGGARIDLGERVAVYVVRVWAPSTQNSRRHLYIFFKTGEAYNAYQLSNTFNV